MVTIFRVEKRGAQVTLACVGPPSSREGGYPRRHSAMIARWRVGCCPWPSPERGLSVR